MELAAVIDLMGGRVVHARRGMRNEYRPVASVLCGGSAPEAVADALLGFHPFSALYVADIDAILGAGDNLAALRGIRARHPEADLWLDCGVRDEAALRRVRDSLACTLVLGSESLGDARLPWRAIAAGEDVVLSLDFRDGQFLGPPDLFDAIRDWPGRLIGLDLARVGAGCGPDLGLLHRLRERAPHARIHLGGGVRGPADLAACRRAGAAGVLLATALHDGSLTRRDLAEAA